MDPGVRTEGTPAAGPELGERRAAPAVPPPKGARKPALLRGLHKLRSPKYAVLVSTTVVIAYLSLGPLIFLLVETFTDQAGRLSLVNLGAVLTDRAFGTLFRSSMTFTLGSTALAVVIGTVLAYLHARTDISWKSSLFAVSLLPIVIPGLLFAVSWVQLASPSTGILNILLEPFLGFRPLNIYSIWGMIWIEGTNLSPVVFLLMLAGFRSMDPSLEEAAIVSGARIRTVIGRVTFPLVKPAFLSATLLTVVRAFDSFDIPALIGVPANLWVFTSRIWREMSRLPIDIGRVGAYASVLLLLAAGGVLLHNWYARRGGEKSVQTIGGKGFRARPRPIRGWARLAANAFVAVYVLTVIALPALTLLYSSLLPINMLPTAEALEAMSLDNYRFAFGHEVLRRGARNSVLLALTSATVVMMLASIAAWIVVRTRIRGRSLLDTVTFLPIVYPSIVLSVALLIVYLRLPLPIYGTLLILLVAYVTKYLPAGSRYASASMYQIHKEVEEAASVAGASWWQTFRRVTLPLIVPGFVAGWIYVAMISVRELGTSILIYSPGSEVLAVTMFRLYFEGRTNEVAAIGVILMLGLLALATVGYSVIRRFGVREGTSDRDLRSEGQAAGLGA